MMKRMTACLIALALLMVATSVSAELTKVEVKTRADIGASGFEKIVGTAYFEVDPIDPHNAVIADIDKAPRGPSGRVSFSSDIYIIRPKDAARSNGIALVEVLNRGRKLVLSGFTKGATNDPVSDADLGDRFLLDRGFTLVWIGWEFDVRRVNGLMGIAVPSAQGVNARVWADFVPANTNERQTVGDLVGYVPADPAAADSTLTVRESQFGAERPIDRTRWTIDATNMVGLTGGFEPGCIYRVSYRSKKLPISGLGLAAFRDVGSWIKFAPGALVTTGKALAFGSSQSGRFLRTFLYNGLNGDEKGRQVYDAAWVHIAGCGGARRERARRDADVAHDVQITRFPVQANQATRDPISGKVDRAPPTTTARGA
ncbi:MAG: alpha/beta hydrolase domain-containing protein [Vicinamibacterales bacterium]